MYFLVSPLTQAESELLARTTPSIWDVLIALFGGFAGAIGITRRVKSNLIPGVAIATALMPPLCTAGYGLANANLSFFAGAFYLFSINCVFIAYATVVMVKIMRLPAVMDLHARAMVAHRIAWGSLVVVTMVPSVYLAFNLVQKEVFSSNATSFVSAALRSRSDVLVVGQEPDYATKTLRVNVVGKRMSSEEVAATEKRLSEFGLAGTKLMLVQSGQDMPDMNVVKKDLLNEFLQTSRTDIAQRETQIAALQSEIDSLRKAAASQIPLKEI